jgi:hypothetical protein
MRSPILRTAFTQQRGLLSSRGDLGCRGDLKQPRKTEGAFAGTSQAVIPENVLAFIRDRKKPAYVRCDPG